MRPGVSDKNCVRLEDLRRDQSPKENLEAQWKVQIYFRTSLDTSLPTKSWRSQRILGDLEEKVEVVKETWCLSADLVKIIRTDGRESDVQHI